ncbi:response regulator transcription factor [Chloroflexus sp.]|uniref:response regulator transcription factor n=1 Tax=Chloroflexus sp. TaxID=1904827 RepID=UPI003C723E27
MMRVPYGMLLGGLGSYVDSYLSSLLADAGYQVWMAIGQQVVLDTLSRQIDVALIDLPGSNYLDQIITLRADFPGILCIIGPRNDQLIVTTLESGADDYIPRPFRGDELLARIRAQLRRWQRYLPPPFAIGHFYFDLAQRTVTYAGTPLTLDLSTFTLLRVLAEKPYHIFPADEVADLVWGRGNEHRHQLLAQTWLRLCQQLDNAPELYGNPTQGLGLTSPNAA